MAATGFSLRPCLLVVGYMLGGLALAMLVPALAAWWGGLGDGRVFLASAGITGFLALGLTLTQRGELSALSLRQALLATSLVWASSIACAALPFWLAGLNYTDAFFEACSGLTTTGATIYRDLRPVAGELLLWRALLQWVGGIGIVVAAILILPALNIGGMQWFRSESSDMSDKILPRLRALALAILRLYLILSAACWLAYMLAGMGAFEALLHAMTTISTGGFSPHNRSLGHYDSVAIESVAIGFMLLGSLPFVAYLRVWSEGLEPGWRETQIPVFLCLLIAAIAAMTLSLYGAGETSLWRALRLAGFNVTAIFTGTGYATQAFDGWGAFALTLFFLIALFGGCAGSTTGGIKIFRVQVMAQFAWQRLRLVLAPNAVAPLRYAGRNLPEEIALSAMIFVFSFLGALMLLALFLNLQGLDALTAWSGALAALSNIGPGLGPMIGPAGHYAGLGDSVKWALAFAMLLGRLELFTILVLFAPRFWRV